MRDIFFFISEAIIGIRRSSVMALIATVIVSVSLIVLGVFLLLVLNLNNLSHVITGKLEIKVFLKSPLTQTDINQLQDKIQNISGVKSIQFISKEVAWRKFKKNFNNLQLDSIMEKSPLPNVITVKIQDENKLAAIAKNIETFNKYVENVSYGGEIARRMASINNFIRLGGLIWVSLLGLSTLLIIVNTIRLTVLARQEEVNIMQLVGATDGFIRGPFIIEGLLLGAAGALGAIGFLHVGYEFVHTSLQASIPYMPLVIHMKALLSVYSLVFLSGVAIGVFGAYLSISKTLKCRF